MQIKKIKDGWEYDGLIFSTKEKAIKYKEAQEKKDQDDPFISRDPLNKEPRFSAYILCDHSDCDAITKDTELQGWYKLIWKETIEFWFCPTHNPFKKINE